MVLCPHRESSPSTALLLRPAQESVNEAGSGISTPHRGGNELAGGARHPPASRLVLFATLLTLASGVVFSLSDVVVVVVAFAFQPAGVNMVAFAGGVCHGRLGAILRG